MQRSGEMLIQGIFPDKEIAVPGTVRAHSKVGAHHFSKRNEDTSIGRVNKKESFSSSVYLNSISNDPEAIFNRQLHMPTLYTELIAKMSITEGKKIVTLNF